MVRDFARVLYHRVRGVPINTVPIAQQTEKRRNVKLALKELRHGRERYTLIAIIVFLMMFMVLFLSGLVNGLGRAVSSGIDNLPADSFVLSDDSENSSPCRTSRRTKSTRSRPIFPARQRHWISNEPT